MLNRDVPAGATPTFSDTLNLSQPGRQILPTIAEVEPKFSPGLRPTLDLLAPDPFKIMLLKGGFLWKL